MRTSPQFLKAWFPMLCIAAAALVVGRLSVRTPAPEPVAATIRSAEASDKLALSQNALKQNKIDTVAVQKMRLARDVEVVGSVGFASDHYAEVGPLIAGRVVSIAVRVGDHVKAGQVLAELESAEVGQAQAGFLTARAVSNAAQANLRRERELAERKVSSERDRELAEAAAVTEQSQLAAATQRLRALGLRQSDISQISDARASRVPLVSPIEGTVIERKVFIGQAVEPATAAFQVADLSRLWVQLELFEKDLPYVHADQRAEIRTEVYPGKSFPARVALLGNVIDEKTRTAPVRIEFDNVERLFRPGQFVTATLRGDPNSTQAAVLAVPRKAVITVEGKSLVFVKDAGGTYAKRPVELGPSGGAFVEARNGLAEGDLVVADGGFLLKSELLR
jgi:cobalt-zinc-cadmium efflux system membrane fusion protein